MASEKDSGFNLEALAAALNSTGRLPADAFEVDDPEVVKELLTWAQRERARILPSG